MNKQGEQITKKPILKPKKKDKKKKKDENKVEIEVKKEEIEKTDVCKNENELEKRIVKKESENAAPKKPMSKLAQLKAEAEQKRKQEEEIKAQVAQVNAENAEPKKPMSKLAQLKAEAEQKRKQEEEIKAQMTKMSLKEESQPKKQEISPENPPQGPVSTVPKRGYSVSSLNRSKPKTEQKIKPAEEKKEEYFYKAPIVCILGHVDTGKTKILDKLRESNVQGHEAGGITQQIGATFFPYSELMKKTKTKFDLNNEVPGLLVIDTPGHETFSNLRSRGSSMCNFAILVVDILHALEKQTLESIELLKRKKTPFLIALNKIDRIFQWKSEETGFSHFDLSKQPPAAQREFKTRIDDITLKFAEIGLNVRYFEDNPDQRKFINILPTSAITGEGLSDLVNKILELSSKYMKNKITFQEKMEATVLEVKNVEGIGITIDAIVSNGHLRENDKIVVCGTDGAISTSVKSLLVPEPLKELRVKSTYKTLKTVKASLGIKIVANDLEKAIAGSRILKVSDFPTEQEAIKQVMEDIQQLTDLDKVGIHLQASSLGSLEALIALVQAENIKIASIGIGKNVTRKDIFKMKAIQEKDVTVGIMLCFDTKIEKEMHELAESSHIKIFEAKIIYNLIDKYKEHVQQLIDKNKKKNMADLVYPCKCQIIPQFIFTKRSPLVLGVEILEGKLRVNMPLYTRNKQNILQVGRVTSIISEKKSVEVAEKGEKVSIKIETNDTPRLIGRDISENDIFYSTLTRKSIDVLKEFFKDEISDDGWRLVFEIKQHLGIY